MDSDEQNGKEDLFTSPKTLHERCITDRDLHLPDSSWKGSGRQTRVWFVRVKLKAPTADTHNSSWLQTHIETTYAALCSLLRAEESGKCCLIG